jgi:EAL and modified HD-GYP domain-containing signal transduction protein
MPTAIHESPSATLQVEAPPGDRGPALARRVIVDERCAVAGYQLVPSARARKPGAAMFEQTGLSKPTFMQCTCADLQDGRLDGLDPKKVVLEIREDEGRSEGCGLDSAMLQAARAKGFKLAFDARLLKKEYAAFVPLASYVILEMGVLELDRAAALARGIQSGTKAVALATQVRTATQHGELAKAGVKLFEGLWYTQPPAKPDTSIQLSYASLIKLLNMVVREAEVNEIEELLKREPTLAYKLLRFINSCGFGHKVEITSFRHAVMTMGLKRLFRWAALLMANTLPNSVAPAVGTLAIVRGRTMELLALEALAPADADLAFVTGMFSMLDSLLAMPLQNALALVSLPAAVTDAILRDNGVFARYLHVAKACETTDEGLLEILSERHRMFPDRIINTHLEALAWGEQFGN